MRDLQRSLRALRRSPGFTLVAVTTLALGIGAKTAISTVVRSVLLRPLAELDADRLVRIFENVPAAENRGRPRRRAMFPRADVVELRQRAQMLSPIATLSGALVTVTGQ